jgi:hypothetical protein
MALAQEWSHELVVEEEAVYGVPRDRPKHLRVARGPGASGNRSGKSVFAWEGAEANERKRVKIPIIYQSCSMSLKSGGKPGDVVAHLRDLPLSICPHKGSVYDMHRDDVGASGRPIATDGNVMPSHSSGSKCFSPSVRN